MPIEAVCAACRTTYRLADSFAGKQVRCKQCRAVFVARPVAPRAEPDRQVRVVVERSPAPPPTRRNGGREDHDGPPRRSVAKTGPGNLPWIVGGAVACTLLLVVGLVAVALIVRGDKEGTRAAEQVAAVDRPSQPPPDAAPAVPAPLLGQPPQPPPAPADPPDAAPPLREANAAPSGDRKLSAASRDKVKHATVYLRVTFGDGTRASGTGFFGAPGSGNLVLTNAHVVGMLAPESPRPRDVEAVLNSGERDERRLKARVLGVDRNSDLAVLDVGAADGLPAPLTVKPARNLQELDQVYVFGFPLGEQLGKEITIRPASVSSLRKRGGILDKVQVNGGMDPGNSGGPVVDGAGDVVGVAVSGFEGRQINFAIPGERVQTLLDGRLAALGTGQPYVAAGGRVGVPVTMEMIDPRGRITEAGLEFWTGERGPNLPPGGQPAAQRPGDSAHERTKLPYVAGTARADVVLPELPAGRVYWVQPYYVTGGRTHYVAGHVYEPPGAPVERKPARLFVQHRAGQRDLNLTTLNTFRVGQDEDGLAATMRTSVALHETVEAAAGGATVRVSYRNADREITVNNERKPSDLLNAVRPNLRWLVGVLRVDAGGNPTQNGVDERLLARLTTGTNRTVVVRSPRATPGGRVTRPTVARAPTGGDSDAAEKLLYFHEPTRHGLEALAVPLPNRDGVAAGEKWSARRSLPIDTPISFESGQLDMTYTYLGRRARNGRDEAVIEMEGVVRPAEEGKQKLGGKVTGRAVVNLETGVVTRAETRAVLDIEAEVVRAGKSVKLLATLESKLERP